VALCVAAAVLLVGHLLTIVVDRVVGHDRFTGTEVIVRVLGMDGELNAPTWYSAAVLLLCAGLAAGIAALMRQRRLPARHWVLMSAVLAFLSLDEAALLHEELSKPLTRSLDLDPERWEYWAWVGPYSVAALLLVAAFARFLWRLPATTRWQIVGAGVLYVSGAAGLELIGGRFWDEGDLSVPYLLVVGAEETLEMLGVVLLAYALLTFLRDHIGALRLELS
jgi:hypothetical protein